MPVYETYTADLLTPVGAYLRIARDAKYSFLLESVEGGENDRSLHICRRESRGSFSRARPNLHARKRGEQDHAIRRRRSRRAPAPADRALPSRARARPAAADRRRDRLFRLRHGAAGRANSRDTGRDDVGLDDCVMMFYLGLLAFDHVQHRVWIIRNVFTEGPGSLREKYDAAVARNSANAASCSRGRCQSRRRRSARGPLRVALEHDARRNSPARCEKRSPTFARATHFRSWSASDSRRRRAPIRLKFIARCAW